MISLLLFRLLKPGTRAAAVPVQLSPSGQVHLFINKGVLVLLLLLRLKAHSTAIVPFFFNRQDCRANTKERRCERDASRGKYYRHLFFYSPLIQKGTENVKLRLGVGGAADARSCSKKVFSYLLIKIYTLQEKLFPQGVIVFVAQ